VWEKRRRIKEMYEGGNENGMRKGRRERKEKERERR
jgi:hypothetical protein